MHSASSRQASYLSRVSLRSRIAASLLSLAISILIILMLVNLGTLPPRVMEAASRLITVKLLPVPGAAPPRAKAAAEVRRAKPPVQPPLPPPPIPSLNMLILSREEFAAADIARLPARTADATGDAGAGQDNGATPGRGEGPNGEHLYNAEWYREPTDAEMVTYLPANRSDGEWAMIACRTIERFRVDDCHELAESPPGSGLARALRLASWQFLVRPPRIGGKAMVGAWVRIRFDFTREKKG